MECNQWWDTKSLAEKRGIVTHKLLVNGWDEMRLHGGKHRQCYSHPVGWDGMRTPHRIKVSAISLTFCWLAWSEMWWLWKKRCVTHSLLVMGDVMILHDRKQGGFYSLPIWHGVTHGLGLAEGRAAPLTYWSSWEWWSDMEEMAVSLTNCWSWEEMPWDCMTEQIAVSLAYYWS